MGHSINAIILKGAYKIEEAKKFDLLGINLDFDLTIFFIDGFFTSYWQEKLNASGYLKTNCNEVTWYPKEMVIYTLMKKISHTKEVQFSLILTDYIGGAGQQYANIYNEDVNVDLQINTISEALKYLGVEKGNHTDEFNAIGLDQYRVNPDYLEKYRNLADELGL